VGVMLYELACGRLPFEGWSAGELLIQHMSAPAPRLPAEMCATPLGRALDAIVQGCMAKEPLDRFSSAAEVAAKLAALGRGETVTIVTPSTPLGRPRRLRYVALAIVGTVGALALGSFLVERALARTATPPAVASMPAVPPRAPVASIVTLTFESDPPGAEARLLHGGGLLGVTPFRRAFPRSAAPVAIELARAGYAPVRLEVSPATPRTVSATLAKLQAPARSSARKRRGHLGSEKTIDPFRR
jgi:hypothetical protein